MNQSYSNLCLISSIFLLDCKVFICDFHREQAWERWLKKKINNCSEDHKHIISLFRRIAHSETTEKCNEAVDDLMKSSSWKDNTQLQEYFSKY